MIALLCVPIPSHNQPLSTVSFSSTCSHSANANTNASPNPNTSTLHSQLYRNQPQIQARNGNSQVKGLQRYGESAHHAGKADSHLLVRLAWDVLWVMPMISPIQCFLPSSVWKNSPQKQRWPGVCGMQSDSAQVSLPLVRKHISSGHFSLWQEGLCPAYVFHLCGQSCTPNSLSLFPDL